MSRKCTSCGAPLTEGKKFCTSCGAPADKVNHTAQTASGNSASQNRPQTAQAYNKTQNAYQNNVNNQYINPDDVVPSSKSKYEPISVMGYLGIMFLMMIPVVGLVMLVIWAFGGCRKVNKRNFARASLIVMLIGVILSVILGFALRSFIGGVIDSIEQETGVNISGDTNKGQSGEAGDSDINGLDDLLKILTGEAMEGEIQMEDLPGSETEDGKSIDDLYDEVEDINAEAEANNNGWPSSLRAYPGGTATATASYRTEITGTSKDEMMGWIEDLKSDGFAFQDFYEFGMTEEDMLSVNGWWATDGTIYLSLSLSGDTLIIDHTNELPDLSGLLGE